MRLSISQETPRIVAQILDIEMFPTGMLDGFQEMDRLSGLVSAHSIPFSRRICESRGRQMGKSSPSHPNT